MNEYFLHEFDNVEIYKKFITYMLTHSDFFSLVYFKYRENEKMKKTSRIIANNLKEFKKYSGNTQKWPNTETYDTSHIYKIVFYRSDIRCLDSLIQVKDLYSWDYPHAPMDLCFYKNGYCWLAVTAHEHMAFLYTNNKSEILELQALGVNLTLYRRKITPFYCDCISAKINQR